MTRPRTLEIHGKRHHSDAGLDGRVFGHLSGGERVHGNDVIFVQDIADVQLQAVVETPKPFQFSPVAQDGVEIELGLTLERLANVEQHHAG